MKVILCFVVLIFLIFFCTFSSASYQCTEITQYGVTFTFTSSLCGTFINGDYWISNNGNGIQISTISPDVDLNTVNGGGSVCIGDSQGVTACSDWCSTNAPQGYESYCNGAERGTGDCLCTYLLNGFQVNPTYYGGQGFDSRCLSCDTTVVPALPYTALPGESIVKVVSGNCTGQSGRNSCIKTAVVLTILDDEPSNVDDCFRPAYVAKEKKFHYFSEVKKELIPNLDWIPDVDIVPNITTTADRYQRVQLDHKGGATGRYLHPIENIPDYGSSIGTRNNDALLRLFLKDTQQNKERLLINFIQYGIDLYYILKSTNNTIKWQPGGGHRPGQKIPLVFVAGMFGYPDWIERVRSFKLNSEDVTVGEGKNTPIWGFDVSESQYWFYLTSEYESNLERRDPYGYIDGGMNSKHLPCAYQTCCTTMTWKGSILAMLLIPSFRRIWNNELVVQYVDRYVTFGIWTKPDKCAPYDGKGEDNYKKKFGPNPKKPGDCIRGSGRFNHMHGTWKDDGGYHSNFQTAMWNKYRNTQRICKYKKGDFDYEKHKCKCRKLYYGRECENDGMIIAAIVLGVGGGALLSAFLVICMFLVVLVSFLFSCKFKKGNKEMEEIED